ncbi:SCO family protein [Microbulbifer sp. OS29]|uniref:SCO family protein n=1 Tax=Microbulbifer okhotskensis TaxID=2926617 RepID=A0A9X2EP89_9GAMM|nr:SCO family protein [Microbulbifer okhotskensis]MCO1335289.1 SCO family protein [Microbulbifer okhotskensis]
MNQLTLTKGGSISRISCWNSWPLRAQARQHRGIGKNALWNKIIVILFLVLLFPIPSAWSNSNLPDDSVYHVASSWLDQNGRKINISDLQGRVQVVSFVYTYCEHSCPIILANLRRIEQQVSAIEQSDIQFLLISLDPERDNPELLKRYIQDKGLNECRWTMLNGNPDDVLELSALLGVRYKPMSNDKKDIAHSNMITVLSKQGKISYQMKGVNEGVEDVVSAISKVVLADSGEDAKRPTANCPPETVN